MTNENAYRSTAPEVISAWEIFIERSGVVSDARERLSKRFGGRRLMVRRGGFGHSTNVVGFERLPEDEDGAKIFDKALVVSKRNMATPNLRTKVGKALKEEMGDLDSPEVDLPGCPSFDFGGEYLQSFAPALFREEGAVYALWDGKANPKIDTDLWEKIPLSEYHRVVESREGRG